MKASTITLKCVNITALSGYLMNVVSMLESNTSALVKLNGVFHLFCCIFLLTYEIQEHPESIKYISFLTSNFGRGILYFWISMICLNDSVVSVIGTSITGLIGLTYIFAAACQHCCCRRRKQQAEVALESPVASGFPENIHQGVSPQGGEPSILPVYTKQDPNQQKR